MLRVALGARLPPSRALAALLFFSMLACSCRRDEPRGTPSIEPVPGPIPAASTIDAGLPAPLCNHRRPFGEDASLALSPPFDALTPCDALAAVFADHDRAAESSRAAGGKVRIDHAQRWDTAGRTLLALVYYAGGDAEVELVAGQVRVAAHLAVVERQGAALALVARGKDPWQPNAEALFNGRAELDPAVWPFDRTDTLLALRTPWSTGMPGVWTNLSLYRLDGATLDPVLEYGVEWSASGMGAEDDELVASTLAFEPRPGGPNDVRMKTTEARCRYDLSAPDLTRVCDAAQPVGAERWRFDGKKYRRIEGKAAPLPRVLHKLWGW